MEHKSNKLCAHCPLRELKNSTEKCSFRHIEMFNLTNNGTS